MTIVLTAAIVTCADNCSAKSEKLDRERGNGTCTGKLLAGSLLLDLCGMITCVVLVILSNKGILSFSSTALYITMGTGAGIAGIWVLGIVASLVKKCTTNKESPDDYFSEVV